LAKLWNDYVTKIVELPRESGQPDKVVHLP
jgi:hypothetical protein